MKTWILVALVVVAAVGIFSIFGHSERGHFKPPQVPTELNPKTVAEVGMAYQKDVEPIFKQACFDCHSRYTTYPWYHDVPGVRQFLDRHVEHGLHGLDMSDGFPFKTHMPVLVYLPRISRMVKSGSMPLWDYRLMHPLARLTDEQKQTIEAWADDSAQKLSATAKD